mmetsp:Transcript_128401/g.411593  ORF Transcript_128401/g.411593 Transcript_128401/m.411593 type:complete len:325 (+) Transcript_128401:789-1763(+)
MIVPLMCLLLQGARLENIKLLAYLVRRPGAEFPPATFLCPGAHNPEAHGQVQLRLLQACLLLQELDGAPQHRGEGPATGDRLQVVPRSDGQPRVAHAVHLDQSLVVVQGARQKEVVPTRGDVRRRGGLPGFGVVAVLPEAAPGPRVVLEEVWQTDARVQLLHAERLHQVPLQSLFEAIEREEESGLRQHGRRPGHELNIPKVEIQFEGIAHEEHVVDHRGRKKWRNGSQLMIYFPAVTFGGSRGALALQPRHRGPLRDAEVRDAPHHHASRIVPRKALVREPVDQLCTVEVLEGTEGEVAAGPEPPPAVLNHNVEALRGQGISD